MQVGEGESASKQRQGGASQTSDDEECIVSHLSQDLRSDSD